MSTRTGVNAGGPDSYSDSRCVWTLCTILVPNRFRDENMNLCRDHALLVWSIVNEQINDSTSTFMDQHPDDDVRPPSEPVDPSEIPPGFIYYIRTGGRIKIGHTHSPWRRLSQYPPDVEVLYVERGNRTAERAEHQQLRAYLADGREWFQDRPEVTDYIAVKAATNPHWANLVGNESYWRRRKTR